MGIMLNKEADKNVELTERINADLRAKMDATSKREAGGKDPDLTEDSAYVEGFSKTRKFAWVWVILGIVVVAGLIIFGVSKH